MSTKSLNWGLLSTARINRSLIPDLRASKRNHLLAVGSRSQDIGCDLRRQNGKSRAHMAPMKRCWPIPKST